MRGYVPREQICIQRTWWKLGWWRLCWVVQLYTPAHVVEAPPAFTGTDAGGPAFAQVERPAGKEV